MAVSTTITNVNGIKEDLADTIWDVSPEEVPFSSNCSKVNVDNTIFEWQTDALAAVSATTAVEGADAVFAAATDTVRLNNQTEIIEKTAATSGSIEATDRAGRAKEMAYQVIRRGKEIKRDFEHHLVGIHQAKVAGTTRKTGSYASYAATNDSFGATGSSATGDGTDVPTVGTPRAFTEILLGEVIDSCFNAGGNPDIIMAGSWQKRKLSQFSGNAGTINSENDTKKVINAVSVYESDYGVMKVVPNRFLKVTDVLVYEQEYWKIGQLRGMKNLEIARTGDAEKRQVIQECGLIAGNEASSGIVLALTTV